MLGDGLRRSHPHRLGGFNLRHDAPHELFDFPSSLCHSINIHGQYGYRRSFQSVSKVETISSHSDFSGADEGDLPDRRYQ